MEKNDRIYVAGHRGLVGSALVKVLTQKGYTNLVFRGHRELDLERQVDVEAFFDKERPEYVFLAAARVGGIHANHTYPAEFIYDNLAVNVHVIHSAYKFGVRKLMFLGSSCIYPRLAPQPMKEEYLLTSPLEPTNEAYAIAKIAGLKMCRYYNEQYRTNFIAVMPTNLYGPNDNYHPDNSHVLPALIRRFHEAKVAACPTVTVWGSGKPRREFMYSEDMADACIFLMENYDAKEIGETINVGTGADISIKELTELVSETLEYKGLICWDNTKPDGSPQKLLDVSHLKKLGWTNKFHLRESLIITYRDYIENLKRI
jgi:GDP-L-fucose synthase